MTKCERRLNRLRARDNRRTWKIFLVSPCKEKIGVWFHISSEELPTKEQIMSSVEGQLNRLGIRSGLPIITAVMEIKAICTKKYGVEYRVIND